MRTYPCPNCDKTIEDARPYCPRCGAKLKGSQGWTVMAVALAFLLACAAFFSLSF